MQREDPRPLARIAHRGGNSRSALSAALSAGVDWIEVDLWWHYGRMIAQHDQPLWPLPLVFSNGRLRRLPERALSLAEVIRLTRGGPQLLLDFKGSSNQLARAVVEQLRRAGAVSRAAICGQEWSRLDATARLAPDLRVFHTFGSAGHILALSGRSPAAPPITSASVAHGLLTPEVMQEFQQRGIEVFAWTVNDPVRARHLVELGVAGITSDRLDLLAGLPEGAEGAQSKVIARDPMSTEMPRDSSPKADSSR